MYRLRTLGCFVVFGLIFGLSTRSAQADQLITVFVTGTFQNGAALSGNYVVDVTTGSAVSADLFVGSLEFNAGPRIAIAVEGFGGIDVSASPPSVGDVFLFGPTACSTLPACAVAATIPGPICSVSTPCGGAHSSVHLTTGIVPLSNGSTTIGLGPTSLTFASQLVGTSSAAQSVTLNNYRTVTLGIISVGFTGADPGDFAQTNTCGSSVAPGASCTISITFKPTQDGSRTAMLSITDNAPDPQNVSLTGTGSLVGPNPNSLSFGTVQVGQSKNLSTALTNLGSTTLGITGITVTGQDIDEFSQANNCGSSLGAGQSCTISVIFKPTETGSDSAIVSISDNGGGSPQQVHLTGAGCVYNPQRHKCVTTLSSLAVQSSLAKSATAVVPGSTGSNSIGTRVLDLVDSRRNDPFLANGAQRELLVRFWYPTPPNQACKLAEYTSPRVWNYFSDLSHLPLPRVTTNSCLDAPVANGAHPVVLFTHGYTGTFTDYTFLFEDLASRGYVVASVDHTYEATAVEFPDGRFVKSLVGSYLDNSWRSDDQSVSLALSVRLDDLEFVLNELERLNASFGEPFAGKLDLTRVALAGHSLGGLATWKDIQQDKRFKAGVLLDPYLADESGSPTETPVMILAMGHEQRSGEECRLWSDLLGPRLFVNLSGAEHLTPTDAVWLAKGTIKTGAMGLDKTIAAVRDYVATFLDAKLFGRAFDLLLYQNYPNASVTAQRQLLCGDPTSHSSNVDSREDR